MSSSPQRAHKRLTDAPRIGAVALRLLAVLALVFSCSLPLAVINPQSAVAADGLTIYVGYAGGPYYEKAHFTDAQIRAMSSSYLYEYSGLKQSTLYKASGHGVTLENLIAAADVDPGNVWRFHFTTFDQYVAESDSYATNGSGWYASSLMRTSRFFYKDLCINGRFTDGSFAGVFEEGKQAVEQSAQLMPTIIAYESAFEAIKRHDDPHWESQNLRTVDGYRLLLGQTNMMDSTGGYSAQGIHSITCVLGGDDGKDLPVIALGEIVDAVQNLKVGQSLTITPGMFNVMDDLIAAEGYKDIKLAATNPDVLGLEQDPETGAWTITVLGKGRSYLTAFFGNSSNDDFVSRIGTEEISVGKGTGSGKGEGDEAGDGSGKGAGKGDGDGDDGMNKGAGDDPDNNGTEENVDGTVVLAAGTQLSPVTVATTAGLGLEGGDDGGVDADGQSQNDPDSPIYELVFDDETPLAEEDGTAMPAVLPTLLAACFALGGGGRIVTFQRAKDH